jgi:membrane-associated phospholipid phosphatase
VDLPWRPSWSSGHTSAIISVATSLTAYYPNRMIPFVGYPLGIAIGFGW